MLKCPIHELPSNIVINNFYVRLFLHDKDLLNASCSGSFTRMKEEDKWDLLDRIQENTEGWENIKGRKSGINYDYECIKYFMGTDDLILVMFMVLILKYFQTILKPLPLILIFQRRNGTSTMHLTKILLIVLLLEILKFVVLIVFCLNLILRKYLSLGR
jgi:hypothetical protein